jgi:hypothetical protein
MLNAIITNDPGASFQINGPVSFNYNGGTPRFDNSGTFIPSPSGTTAFNGIVFNNYKAINLSSGILAFNSPYADNSNSVLNYFLSGNLPGVSYGQLQVPGSVTLAGTLAVSLTNHYIPTTNDSFTVLTAGSRSGNFASFNYSSNGLTLSLSNTPTAEIVQVTSVSLQQSNLPAPLGVISWWRAENDATDAAGTNNGTLTNGAGFAAGKVGQSFLLDGINDYVTVPDSASLRPASVTLEAWVKIASTNGIQLIFAKPLGSASLDSYGLALQNGVPLAAICDNSGFGTFVTAPTPLVTGQWYHLAFTFDAATQQQVLYVNGAPVAAANAGKSMAYDTHPLLLGADIENEIPGYTLNGQIDEATIYNRALQSGEIASIYNVGANGKLGVDLGLPVLYMDGVSSTSGRLYWSTNYPDFHLQYNTTLAASNWAASGRTPVVIGTNFVVTNSLTSAQKYYRLSSGSAPYTPPPPTLAIQPVSSSLVRLLWPVNDDQPFLLQSAASPNSLSWAPVSATPAVSGANNVVTNAISGPQRFFRLSNQ